jgi:DNA-binding NarL/FixJ family response regulator
MAVRVLLVEDDPVEARAVQRDLGGRFEVRVVATLAEALHLLAQGGWRPDVVVANSSLPDSEGLATLHALQNAAAGTPVVVTAGVVTEAVRRQLDALNAAPRNALMHHGVAQSQMAYRIETIAEIDRVTRQAADAAVSRAIEELLDRLGLGDEEGLRMAIRLARGWEAAKVRFVSALTTGLASAILLAIGAGLVAMMRQGGSK